MANCNCNDFPISCAPHAPGGDCCHHHHGCPPHPCPPPDYKGGTSMYIGARYVPIFADPVEWDDEREYEPLTIVTYNGDCYTSKCYVPKGAQLPPYPDGQTKYWVKTSDYNYQFADLKKTVTDLSRLVEQFQKDNEKFTELINGWNEKVIQWEKDMAAWGERLDTVESNVSDLTDNLNAEIARAKAAEQANAAAIAKETTDRQQAISELDAAYKAADAAIREDFTAADTALSNRITANKTDIDSLKAEQKIQNTNISNNAKNISDNSAEIAKHAKRLSDLESNASDWDTIFPDTTIAQEVQKEELARTNGDTTLNGRCDAIAADVEEVRDIANHKVDTTTYTAGQAAQDAKITAAQNAANKANTTIGNWNTDHPGQTISECATSLENEVEAVDAKADANAANIGNWNTEHPGKTISQAVSDVEADSALSVKFLNDAKKAINVSTLSIADNDPDRSYLNNCYLVGTLKGDRTAANLTPVSTLALRADVKAAKDELESKIANKLDSERLTKEFTIHPPAYSYRIVISYLTDRTVSDFTVDVPLPFPIKTATLNGNKIGELAYKTNDGAVANIPSADVTISAAPLSIGSNVLRFTLTFANSLTIPVNSVSFFTLYVPYAASDSLSATVTYDI